MNRTPVILPAADSELARLVESICDGTIAPAERDRLESLLTDDRDAKLYYVACLDMHAQMQWITRGEGQEVVDSPAIDVSVGTAVEHPVGTAVELPSGQWPQTPNPEPPFPTLSTTNYPLPTSDFVGSWAFSCMVSAVIMGVAMLGAWAYKITHHQHIAEAPSQSIPSDTRQEMVFVGRITGMVDVKWSDDPRYLPPPDFAHVPLGREYRLDSGLLEITYDSGAKVILEGPCTYEVESTAGGYLALGKLTAKVVSGQWPVASAKPQAANQKSPSSFILHPSSLFSVRTPTAVITDLGTEFGVEVCEKGTTMSRVFRGSVRVEVVSGEGRGQDVVLRENESARVERGAAESITVIRRESAASATFVRRMPQWVRVELFNTGVGLKEGDPDPHWQLVARGDDPNFKPRPAVVTTVPESCKPNDPAQSQWISTGNGSPHVPNVTYTFRTTFEIANALPETAVLRGRFIVDNSVQAIRLNGRQLPVPWHGERAVNWFSGEFSAGKHCIKGINTLEIDVLNGATWESSNSNGPMRLRVELSGSVFSEKKGG